MSRPKNQLPIMNRTARSFAIGIATGVGIITAVFFATNLSAQLTEWYDPNPDPALFCYDLPQVEVVPFNLLSSTFPNLPVQIQPDFVCYEQPLIENREFDPYE